MVQSTERQNIRRTGLSFPPTRNTIEVRRGTTMPSESPKFGRRALITGAALTEVAAAAPPAKPGPPAQPVTTLADVPLGSSATITVERRGQIALIGLNRPFIQNRLDPPARARLAETFYQYEH